MFEEYSFESDKDETWPKITVDTTIEELQYIHKKIWQYAMDNGCKPITPYTGDCAACEYVACVVGCDNCPIDWPDGLTCRCPTDEDLFSRWCNARSKNEALILARQIRDVKWKENGYALHNKRGIFRRLLQKLQIPKA